MNTTKLTLKELVRTYRERKDLSQETLARMLNVSGRTIWNIENIDGQAEKQTLDFWKKLCNILEIPKEEVF